MIRLLWFAGIFAVVSASAWAVERPKVVSFSALLTEIAGEVGGDAVNVVGVVPPGVDPHGYQPTPADLRAVADASLVLVSGKNLEPYLAKLPAATGGRARLLAVGDAVPSLQPLAQDHDHAAGDSHDHDHEIDPHWWHSVANVRRATLVVRDALTGLLPADRALFARNASAFLGKLTALEKWTRQQVALVPRDQRKLVTSHDAFQYFARDYGFEILAIEGLSTEQEASARRVGEVIAEIRSAGVKAVFFEDRINPKVTAEITRDTGAKVGGMLYADGPGADAPTYDAMMRHNVTTIVEALR